MSNKHWKERLKAEIRAKQARSRTLRQEMEELYLHHYKVIESEIEGFLYRYAEREKIDRVRAQQLVDEFDVKAFEATAKKYVAEKNFSSRANSELRLYNLKMRMKAHELLQYRLDLELVALSEGERQLTEKFLTEAFVREMEEQAGLLGQSVLSREQLDRLAQSRIHLEFHGAEWSESIWKRQRALRVILQEDMEKMVLKGLHPTAVVPRLRKEFGVSASQAKRLAVTEMARMSSEAQRLSFEEYGYEWYEFIAEPSACERCKELDGKKIRVREMEIGVNASPIHPNCHCTMGAYYEKAEETGQKQMVGATIEKSIAKNTKREYNRGVDRNKDPNKRRPISVVRQKKLTKSFRNAGGFVWQNEEAAVYLRNRGADACCLGEDIIVLQKKPVISEVLEELYHAEQYKNGLITENPRAQLLAEIDAQKYLLSISEEYNIPKTEIEQTKKSLALYQEQLKELERYEE